MISSLFTGNFGHWYFLAFIEFAFDVLEVQDGEDSRLFQQHGSKTRMFPQNPFLTLTVNLIESFNKITKTM